MCTWGYMCDIYIFILFSAHAMTRANLQVAAAVLLSNAVIILAKIS
jgi:hypothetical protein